jgi:hypothetical protein
MNAKAPKIHVGEALKNRPWYGIAKCNGRAVDRFYVTLEAADVTCERCKKKIAEASLEAVTATQH